jgi:hypothetical protein
VAGGTATAEAATRQKTVAKVILDENAIGVCQGWSNRQAS